MKWISLTMKSLLTINDVKLAAKANDIDYKNSTKLYYKTFAFNLSMKHINIWHHIYRDQASEQDTQDIRQLHYQFNNIYNKFTRLLDSKNIEYRTRRELNFNLYFNDPEVFELALKSFNEYIIEIFGPVHDNHLTTMKNSRKIVVRENLWYKKYRFKISYRGTTEFQETVIPSIMEYKDSLSDNEIKLSSNIYRILDNKMKPSYTTSTFTNFRRFHYRGVQPWHTCTVYLDNEENYVMYKMMVPGESDTEHEILLLSELESDK